ncbi:MAG TPA: hypothetical protein VF316_25365 [Polyangiaceae bacterium]
MEPSREPPRRRTHPTGFSFGGTAAIVTSMGVIVGFSASTVAKGPIVSSLLIVALADNISDSLSIHLYQESENLDVRAAFRATLTNFAARLVVSLSFVALVLVLPRNLLAGAALGWGMLLLGVLSYVLARARKVSAWREVAKHLLIAAIVVVVSRVSAALILAYVP